MRQTVIDLVHHLARLLAPWQAAFSDSKPVSTAVTSLHIAALLFGGGYAVAADRATLRLTGGHHDERSRLVRDLGSVHRPVLIAIAVLFVSGLALAAADVETFATSWLFWVKMVIVLLLLGNGAVLKASGDALGRENPPGASRAFLLERRLRRSAVLSIALWTITLVLGTALAEYA